MVVDRERNRLSLAGLEIQSRIFAKHPYRWTILGPDLSHKEQ